jgi:hypothetical protein
VKRPAWLHLPHRQGPSWLQLWRARNISVVRIAERERRAAPAGAPQWRHAAVIVAAVTGLVAAIAGVVSYSHITALGLRTYQGPADAHMLAIPIDGLIVAGSVILAAGSALGWLGVVPGVVATLFANLQFGLPHGRLAAVVSTWPAVAFTVACFMLERWLRSRRRGAGQGSADALWQVLPSDAQSAALASMRATFAAGNPWSGRALETRFGLSRADAAKVRELVLAEANGHVGSAPEAEES